MHRTLMLCSVLLLGNGGLLAQTGPQDLPPFTSQSIEQCVRDLGSADIPTRQAAVDQLTALGSQAIPFLEEALVSDENPEVRWNARWLLRELRREHPRSDRPGEELRDDLRELLPFRPRGDLHEKLRRQLGLDDWPHRFGFFFDDLEDVDDLFQGLRERAFRLPQGQEDFSSSGVKVQRDADGSVRVEVREQTPEGNVDEQVYEAESLEALEQQYPELMEKYGLELEGEGTFRFDLRGDPFRQRSGWDPFRPRAPRRGDARPELLGVFVEPVDGALRQELQLLEGEHLVVRRVDEGLGRQLGVQEGDVILELNGVTLTSSAEVRRALRSAPDGGDLRLKIVRPGHGEITLQGTMPAPERRRSHSRWY